MLAQLGFDFSLCWYLWGFMMYKNFSRILRILWIMDGTKLTRVLDMLGIDCAVAHDSSMLFD